MIQNNKKLQAAIDRKTALFGTLDSWLLYRLRQGNQLDREVEHISDVTSCSATGFYDPFTMQWAKWALSLFAIKANMLPTVVDNSYKFGCTDRELFGHEIPIACSVGIFSHSESIRLNHISSEIHYHQNSDWRSVGFNVGLVLLQQR